VNDIFNQEKILIKVQPIEEEEPTITETVTQKEDL
jgi:hypothetical protein